MALINDCADCASKCSDGAKRCRICYNKYLKKNRPRCTTCSKIVKWGSKRCYACYTNPDRKCKHCGKEVNWGDRCSNCYQKERASKLEYKKIKCKKCDNLIEKNTRSKTECYKCWYKEHFKNPENLEKRRLANRKAQRKKRGIDLDPKLLIEKKKSDGWVTKSGYKMLYLPKHPYAQKNGAILEHKAIMTDHLKRPLYKGETIHHINGIRDDNRIENLELWDSSHPPGQRVKEKIEWCKEYLIKNGVSNLEGSI